MKYAKYILIVVALYFGIKYHNIYSKTEKEIHSIEDAYKDEKTRKFKEYQINFENIKYQRDTVNLYLGQKYLELSHRIHIQYLQGRIDEETYGVILQELKKSESEEVLANTDSWISKDDRNIWPSSAVPELLYEKRNSADDNSNALFVLCGILLPVFLLIDWKKGRRQSQTQIQNNQYPISTKEHEDNTMEFDNEGKNVILERQVGQDQNGQTISAWVDENGNPVEVPEEVTAAWDKAKVKASISNTVISA